MLKLKLQYFGHLMWRVDSLEKTPMLGGIVGRRRRGQQRMAGWHHQLDRHEFGWTPGVGDGQGGLVGCKTNNKPATHQRQNISLGSKTESNISRDGNGRTNFQQVRIQTFLSIISGPLAFMNYRHMIPPCQVDLKDLSPPFPCQTSDGQWVILCLKK